jgi:hypothetical protein
MLLSNNGERRRRQERAGEEVIICMDGGIFPVRDEHEYPINI